MKIIITEEYKSLKPFVSDELNKLTIITGKNGSGKSQLVELIATKGELIRNNQHNQPTYLKFDYTVNRIQVDGIKIDSVGTISFDNIKNHIQNYVNTHQSIKPSTKKLFAELIAIGFNNQLWTEFYYDYSMLYKDDGYAKIFNTYLKPALLELHNNNNNYINQNSIDGLLLTEFDKLLSDFIVIYFDVCREVMKYRNKNYFDLEPEDFYGTTLSEKYFDNSDLIHSNLATIFNAYLKKRDLNAYQCYRKKDYNEENNAISSDEFAKIHIAPWEILNDLFNDLELNYKFKDISLKDYSPDANSTIQLIKKSNSATIDFNFLSSGEKVLIGLAIKLFTSSFYKDDLKYPDMIVLDEPDAHLHPEMSNQLIKVLNNTFVEKLGIHVIITSHSPSTIALAPEESIYQLQNDPICQLKKVTKDEALSILTGNLPNLSIDYRNHRQIFVESPTDLMYYQTLFNKLNQKNQYKYKLYFMSNGYGKGNCDQVIKIVSDIRSAKNNTVYGIIDWDNKNKSTEYIFVHGESKRYNIESFLFDPIYLSILFIDLKYGDFMKHLVIDSSYNPYDLINDPHKSKLALEFIWNKLNQEFPNACKIDIERIIIKYSETLELKIPIWFSNQIKHSIKEKIVKAFPALNGIASGHIMEEKLITVIARCSPYIPTETKKLFNSLAN